MAWKKKSLYKQQKNLKSYFERTMQFYNLSKSLFLFKVEKNRGLVMLYYYNEHRMK